MPDFEVHYVVHKDIYIIVPDCKDVNEAKRKLMNGEVDLSESLCGRTVTRDMIREVTRCP